MSISIQTDKKSRICNQCSKIIKYQSPAAKRKADELNSICKQCCGNQLPKKLTKLQKDFIYGLMLGDGSIVYPSKKFSKYPRLTVRRQEKDKDYIFWQYSILKDFYKSGPKFLNIFDKRTKKYYTSYNLSTKTGEIFRKYHDEWYPNGKKTVPSNLILTPMILLIWFLDDGCIIKKNENNLTIKFATHGFDHYSVELLKNKLQEFCDAKFNIYSSGKGHIIKASTKTALKVIKVIDNIFPKFMERKQTWIKKL